MSPRLFRFFAPGLLAIAALVLSPLAPSGPAAADTLRPAPSVPGITSADFWLATASGDVWSFGHAGSYGSLGGAPLNKPIVGIAPTVSGNGYWLVASDGGIFSFGDAPFYGSTGAYRLNKPIVGMAPTPTGHGYWMVASDGGIFSFGDAGFYGSTGSYRLNKPIVGMAPAPAATGYWLLASDGGVFSFGSAVFHGSTGGNPTPDPAEKLVASAASDGYWIVDQNGTAHPFGTVTGAPPVQGLMFNGATGGDRAVLFALSQLDKPYIWGGNGPVGYDCSGLALKSWQVGAGVTFARVADDQYHTAGPAIALGDLQAGDLVFWGSNLADWTTVYHTALYVGGGQIVEATGDHVQINSLVQWGISDLMPNGVRP